MGHGRDWLADLLRRWYRWLRAPLRPYAPDGRASQPAGFARSYGGLQRCYSAAIGPDGWLVVQVHHRDGPVRAHLERHRLAPAQFLRNLDAYAASGTPARLWLARVVADHRTYFEQGRVRFEFQ